MDWIQERDLFESRELICSYWRISSAYHLNHETTISHLASDLCKISSTFSMIAGLLFDSLNRCSSLIGPNTKMRSIAVHTQEMDQLITMGNQLLKRELVDGHVPCCCWVLVTFQYFKLGSTIKILYIVIKLHMIS